MKNHLKHNRKFMSDVLKNEGININFALSLFQGLTFKTPLENMGTLMDRININDKIQVDRNH